MCDVNCDSVKLFHVEQRDGPPCPGPSPVTGTACPSQKMQAGPRVSQPPVASMPLLRPCSFCLPGRTAGPTLGPSHTAATGHTDMLNGASVNGAILGAGAPRFQGLSPQEECKIQGLVHHFRPVTETSIVRGKSSKFFPPVSFPVFQRGYTTCKTTHEAPIPSALDGLDGASVGVRRPAWTAALALFLLSVPFGGLTVTLTPCCAPAQGAA